VPDEPDDRQDDEHEEQNPPSARSGNRVSKHLSLPGLVSGDRRHACVEGCDAAGTRGRQQRRLESRVSCSPGRGSCAAGRTRPPRSRSQARRSPTRSQTRTGSRSPRVGAGGTRGSRSSPGSPFV
jgi:hypothetical protein